jgi:hypothetical protein
VWERREVYDRALRESPILFAEIPESGYFTGFYRALGVLKTLERTQQHQAIMDIHRSINSWVAQNHLSRRHMRKGCHPKRPKYGEASEFAHPLSVRLKNYYVRLTHRNMPQDFRPGCNYTFVPSDKVFKRLKALWSGIPGDKVPYFGPNPIGEQLTGGVPEQPYDISTGKPI